MKKIRKTTSVVLVAMFLLGCSPQTTSTEPEALLQDIHVLQEQAAIQKDETVASEETESTQPSSGKEQHETAPAEKSQTTEPTLPPVTEPPTDIVPPATAGPSQTTDSSLPPATEPPVTEPEVIESTEPPAEIIDTAALESYGRSYASSTYGYNGTSVCTPGTGAGFFPAATKVIMTMEEGRQYVREAVDSQYKRDMAYGYLPYEEIDGVIVRCPINVKVECAGDNTYTITVYYGGTA
ncbi:MAG: hypothetical protein ACI3VZ_06970 [Faecousia sp.]